MALSSLAVAAHLVAAELSLACAPHIVTVRPSSLSTASAKAALYDQVLGGNFNAVLIHPPSTTFGRRAFSSRKGGAPHRDVSWPKGFPWLERSPAEEVRSENELADFAMKIIRAASSVSFRMEKKTRIWFLHPEDRGSKHLGSPASLWQWPEVREFEHLGLARTAFFPCSFDIAGPRSPLGVLSDIPQWNSHDCVVRGWPTFIQKECEGQMIPRLYRGPLPRKCAHEDHSPIPRVHQGCRILELSLIRCLLKDHLGTSTITPGDGDRNANRHRVDPPTEIEIAGDEVHPLRIEGDKNKKNDVLPTEYSCTGLH